MARTERYSNRWTVGEYTFFEVEDHGFSQYHDSPMYKFVRAGDFTNNTYYESLDRAMVAAVGEKYTGPRGASGSGVGTAADWFMYMIGYEWRRQVEELHDKVESEDWKYPEKKVGVLRGIRMALDRIRNI